MDVIAKSGEKLARSAPRKCLICTENASVCARSRAHSVSQLQARTGEILKSFIASALADAAEAALIAEVNVTPKPGLVDRNNSGANADMDADMFHRSAKALRPYFERMARLTADSCESAECENFFEQLRSLGLEAEEAMMLATGGVNTHRGAIYSLGLLVCAAACELFNGWLEADAEGAHGLQAEHGGFDTNCAARAAGFARELGDCSVSTSNGAGIRRKYGASGPVQQAQQGFPAAMLAKSAKAEYYNRHGAAHEELAWAYALLAVMTELEDNNALHRGGSNGAEFVKKRALELKKFALSAETEAFYAALCKFDEELIELNISCGGSADMLALALFLDEVEAWTEPLHETAARMRE